MYDNRRTPTRARRPSDTNQLAHQVVREATGQADPPFEAVFGIDIEYAVLQKSYGVDPIQRNGTVRPSASVAT